MNNYLILTPDEVINFSLLDSNVDYKIISRTIGIAEEINLKPVLGSGLYNSFIEALSNSGETLSNLYIDLLDKVKPYLIAQVCADYIVTGSYRIGGKGVLKNTDDSASELQETEMNNLRNYYLNQVSHFKAELLSFLKANNLIAGSQDTKSYSGGLSWYIPGKKPINIKAQETTDFVLPEYVSTGSTGLSYEDIRTTQGTLLITPKQFINQSILDDNTDLKQIARLILTVQQVNLKPVLTAGVYNQLMYSFYQSQFSGATMNPLFTDLHGIVKNYLIHKVTAESTMLTYRFSNKGIVKNTDKNATELSEGELNNLKNYYDNIAGTYKNELIEFLKKYGMAKCYADTSSDSLSWYIPNKTHKQVKTEDVALSGLMGIGVDTDTYITGGTYSSGVLSLFNNSGNTITIDGFLTGSTSTDTFLADAYINDDILFLALNTGDVYNVSLSGFSKTVDVVGKYLPITGGTLTSNNGLSYAALLQEYDGVGAGLSIYLSDATEGNIYGASEIDMDVANGFMLGNRDVDPVNGNHSGLISNKAAVIISQGDNANYNSNLILAKGIGNFGLLSLEEADVRISALGNSGNRMLTVDNDGFISATTLSITDTVVTGGTYTNGVLALTNNYNDSFIVSGFYTGSTDIYTTGGTFDNTTGVISFANNTGGTFNVSGLTNPYILNLPTTTGSTYGVIAQNNVPVFQTYGVNNLFLGNNAGNFTLSTATGRNIAIGVSALTSDSTGNNNTAIGYQALMNNNVGNQNVALGNQALISLNTVSNGNTAIGYQALYSFSGYPSTATTTERLPNTAVGGLVLANNVSGYGNTGLGYASLFANTTGGNNAAFGYWSMRFNTTGNENTAFGTTALRENTTGNGNVALGRTALRSNTTGSTNVAIGFEAGYSTSGDSNVFIGKQAGYSETGSNKLYIANSNTTTPLIGGDFGLGHLGVNTNAPTHAFHVVSSADPLRLEGLQSASDTSVLTVDASGVVRTRLVSTLTGASATTITDYVTTGTSQTITGAKTFSTNDVTFGSTVLDVTNNRLSFPSSTGVSRINLPDAGTTVADGISFGDINFYRFGSGVIRFQQTANALRYLSITSNATGVSFVGMGSVTQANTTLSLTHGTSVNNASLVIGGASTNINLSRNLADANAVAVITQSNTGSTGNILNLANNTGVVASVSRLGAIQSLYQRFGSGSPEGVVTAPIGAFYSRTDGGAGTSLYVKESGTGNTGWIAK